MINLHTRYGAFAAPPTTAYPEGSAINESTPGALDGLPFEKDWVNDIAGFMQSALERAGVVANDTPESVSNPQVLDAITALLTVAVASTAEARAGTDNEKIMSALSVKEAFEEGSNANGYWRRWPSGLIEQWGQTAGTGAHGTVTVSYPVSFTTLASISAMCNRNENATVDDGTRNAHAISLTQLNCINTTPSSIGAMNWYAIGY